MKLGRVSGFEVFCRPWFVTCELRFSIHTRFRVALTLDQEA